MTVPLLPLIGVLIAILLALAVGFNVGVRATRRALRTMAYDKLNEKDRAQFILLLDMVLKVE